MRARCAHRCLTSRTWGPSGRYVERSLEWRTSNVRFHSLTILSVMLLLGRKSETHTYPRRSNSLQSTFASGLPQQEPTSAIGLPLFTELYLPVACVPPFRLPLPDSSFVAPTTFVRLNLERTVGSDSWGAGPAAALEAHASRICPEEDDAAAAANSITAASMTSFVRGRGINAPFACSSLYFFIYLIHDCSATAKPVEARSVPDAVLDPAARGTSTLAAPTDIRLKKLDPYVLCTVARGRGGYD